MNLQEIVTKRTGKAISQCSNEELYFSLLEMTKGMAEEKVSNEGKRKLYYISAEFLIGKLLSNNLINLGIYEDVKKLLADNGKSLAEIEEVEPEPSLGNGGLGRLAACFLDSIATLGLPGDGIGLNYHLGLFKQEFKDHLQKELPNPWIEKQSWLTKTDVVYPVSFRGLKVNARMYDIAVTGYHDQTNKLHLFDIDSVDEGIVEDGIHFDKEDIAKNLTLFLYPDDSDEKGRLLRIYQQYFMVSSAAQMILDECVQKGSTLYDLPDYAGIMDQYEKLHKDMQDGKVVSAYALDRHGIAAAVAKMAFGNGMGVKIEHNLDPRDFFAPGFGDIILEVSDGKVGELSITYTVIGEVTADGNFSYGNTVITVDEAENAWKGTLEKVFKTVSSENDKEAADRDEKLYRADSIYVCKNKVAKPRVFIPVFPGTNCEYDSTRAFERAGAEVDVKVFKNLTAEDIHDSVELFEKAIDQAQIIMFPGGFSAGDEPDGSAKFFATAFQNAKIKEAVMKLVNERDGLALGICNGFQALIKLGLVPYGEITAQKENSPTLTYNTIGRHISKMVYTKVVTNKSPWLAGTEVGNIYCNPASHGEGRFVAPKEWLDKLFENGQVATQYVNEAGQPTMDEEWNVNGSYMAIEGITSPDGRVLGKMAHAERKGRSVAMNIYGEQDMKLFESGVKYFK